MKTKRLIQLLLPVCLLFLQTCKEIEKQMLVSTGTITNILTTTADAGGEVLDIGEGATKFGHCYSTSPNTTISGPKTEYSNPPLGGFTSALTGLTPDSKYYIKAYLSRGSEVVYGKEITFTTLSDSKPEVTTDEITGIDKTTAVAGGEVTGQGGTPVTERGICYSLATAPTIDNNKIQSGSGTGKFVSNVEGLTPDKKYYVRAYAKNMGGISYGNERSFSTLPDIPVPPTVTTDEVTLVTSNSAISGGNVTAEGSSTVTAKGVCWGTNTTPTIEVNNKSNEGTGTGHYTSTITGLDPGTKYFVRAYATNSAGPSYGTEYNFTTSAVIPTLNTLPVTSITATGASSGGNITSTGGASIIAKGVCWKTSPGPNIYDNKTENGIGPDDFVSALTNLQPGTKYYVRAYATNSVGPGYGNEVEFTTYLSPSVTTDEPTSVTKTTATLNGTVNANGQSTTVTFEYGTTTGYGLTINATQSPVSGTVNTPVSASISGLTEGTVYHYRVKAVSSGGTSFGDDKLLTTLCNSATTSTEPATGINSTSATLNGYVNANGFSTIVTFEYGITVSYGSIKTATQSPLSGNSQTAVSTVITGLTPNTTYYYRVKAESCGGIVYSTGSIFSTSCTAPSATTGEATNILSNSATLNGTVNANSFATTVTFEYGTTTGYGSSKTATQSPVSGSTATNVSTNLTGLNPNTFYHFRIKSENCGGIIYSSDNTLTTPCTMPSAATNAASGITPTGSTLNGNVNANGFSTTVTFEYGLSTSYGTIVTAAQSPVTGSSATPVNVTLSGLAQNTVYHYRAKAMNCGGTVYGSDVAFTTLCTPPSATTSAATSITDVSVRLNGTVNASNFSTLVTFEYGPTTSYGNSVAATPGTVTGSSGTSVYASVSGLTRSTTYHFRVKAVNCGGTVYGTDQVVATTFCPPSLTASHVAGIVAPENKTVTYVVVESNLSGSNKCWITRNLGAATQASSPIDATEASAGWYWQFGRSTGYKHDGTTRTPSTTWSTPISDNNNWKLTSDPCALLLGTGWRIPTQTEWDAVLANIGWDGYTQTYTSVLKLHAAGFLYYSDGNILYLRGSAGHYWSSNQHTTTTQGWRFTLDNLENRVNLGQKAEGATIRCLKD